MLHIAIHDILQPLLQESSIISTHAISHRDINLLVSEINSRNGGDEVLTGISKNNQMNWNRKKKLTAVPERNASTIRPSFHACSISSIVKSLSMTSNFWMSEVRYVDPVASRSLASSSTLPLVTPSRMTFAPSGAVTSSLFLSFVSHTMKKLLAPASVT